MVIRTSYKPSLFFPRILFLFVLLFASISISAPVRHIIEFGGARGSHFVPEQLEVVIGDTIEWKGDMAAYKLASTSVPPGADPFGPITTGNTFSYIIRIPGDYQYKSVIYVSLGMVGRIKADTIHNGLSNEGREFYLAMLYPNYNTSKNPFFGVYAMINSYYQNEVSISYYDELGRELPAKTYRLGAKSSIKVPLDTAAMKIDLSQDMPFYKSCHITSKRPITVEYLSVGPCSGGSYLALPVLTLGKQYVAASYNDNPGEGAISNHNNSGGAFIVVGTVDGTLVQITPATTTTFNHTGAIHGFGSANIPVPYNISLNKGQTYLVRSSGDDNENDMSGSIIEATNPIAVISGHENAYLGAADPYTIEERDFMIEQMIPYEYWDSLGYISIPLAEPTAPAEVGNGDAYRIYTFNNSITNLHQRIGSGGNDFSISRFHFAEKLNVTGPTETYSTDGKKISVIQYDQRSQSTGKPWPAPSMMNVVPRSRWKKFYSFNVLDNGNVWQISDAPYINVISDNLAEIKISINGGVPTGLTALTKLQTYSSFSGSDNGLTGTQYKLSVPVLNPSAPYYLTSQYPFMVYFYEMRNAATTSLGSNTPPNVPHEYATAAGMQLNTGAEPQFRITIDSTTKCSRWHICVRDISQSGGGIRAAMLVDDPDGVYFEPGAKLQNVSLDTNALGYEMGEYHPRIEGSQEFCFDVKVDNTLAPAVAPVAVIDNNGNAAYFKLQYKAPTLMLATDPPTPNRADSIVFPVNSVGQEICTTFVVKNTASVGGKSVRILQVSLNNGGAFVISQLSHLPPFDIAPNDSLTVKLCYFASDTLRHRDSLRIQTDCSAFSISLDAHGQTGLILAEDMDFGYVGLTKEACKEITVRNVGSLAFKITSLKLSDTKNFEMAALTLAQLPLSIKAGGTATVKVCFHPKVEGPYSEQLTFTTDLGGTFATSIKNFSYLSGTGALISAVRMQEQISAVPLEIHPNPASGNSIIVTFPKVLLRKGLLSISDVLGREVYKKDILANTPQVEIPIEKLPVGMYYVLLSSEDGVMSQKLKVVR